MPTTYKSLHNLPELAGLCSLEKGAAAAHTAHSVEDSVKLLKQHYYCLRRMAETLIMRLTAEPIYELKMGWSHHAFLCTEMADALRRRITEMRQPPLGLDKIPHPSLNIFFNEAEHSPTTAHLLTALYRTLIPWLKAQVNQQLSHTHPLADYPTQRVLSRLLPDLVTIEKWGCEVLENFPHDEQALSTFPEWKKMLDLTLTPPALSLPPAVYSAQPKPYNKVPQRDARFSDPYNMGVHAEAFLYDETYSDRDKVLMMLYKRLREIDVPEMMATIITEQKSEKPWEFFRDMVRQLWDEARHAMMGELGFVSLGIDWPRLVKVNFTWSLGLNTQLSAKERHGVLYFIEQGLMPKTGKRHEWEIGVRSANPLAALFQDYDWADEVLHARIGRDWYVSQFSTPQEAIKYGSDAWDKVLIGWQDYQNKGLTQHHNWWPDLYAEACKIHNITPDPHTAAFSQTYEHARADLEEIPSPHSSNL